MFKKNSDVCIRQKYQRSSEKLTLFSDVYSSKFRLQTDDSFGYIFRIKIFHFGGSIILNHIHIIRVILAGFGAALVLPASCSHR